MSSNTQQSSMEICKVIVIWGNKSIRGSALSKHAHPPNVLWNQVTPAKVMSTWWGHFCSGGALCAPCEQSYPDRSAELLCSISASLCVICFFLWSLHLQAGRSHCTDYHRQATWAVQENRKAKVHLTHRKVSYSPWVLLTGVSRSRSFPSQDCSWTSKVKATCYVGYLSIIEEV